MEKQKNSFSLKSALIAVLVLFFIITGLIFLFQGKGLIGLLLIVAGVSNALTILSIIKPRENISVIINLIFGGVALFTAYDYFFHKHRFLHFIWLIAAVIYFMIALNSYMKLKKKSNNK
jgi:hypothetical protein